MTCTIANCDKPHKARGWCGMHYHRWERNGDPLVTQPCPTLLPGEASVHWRGRDIGYDGAHRRVRTQRGSAREHPCVDCGKPALHWSYDHSDPDEMRAPDGRPYSPDPWRYAPRCAPCHKAVDLAAIAAKKRQEPASSNTNHTSVSQAS